jgi:hypothetical protein
MTEGVNLIMIYRIGRRWLTPITLATQEAEIRKIVVRSQLGKCFMRPCLKYTHHKKELVE